MHIVKTDVQKHCIDPCYARLLTTTSTHIYTSTVHSPVHGTGTARIERVLADQRQTEARL